MPRRTPMNTTTHASTTEKSRVNLVMSTSPFRGELWRDGGSTTSSLIGFVEPRHTYPTLSCQVITRRRKGLNRRWKRIPQRRGSVRQELRDADVMTAMAQLRPIGEAVGGEKAGSPPRPPSSERQLYAEPRAGLRPALDPDPATQRHHDPLRQRESETGARAAASRDRLRRRLEHVREIFLGVDPSPSSSTAICTREASRLAVTRTVPSAGVCRTAFESRFCSTRATRGEHGASIADPSPRCTARSLPRRPRRPTAAMACGPRRLTRRPRPLRFDRLHVELGELEESSTMTDELADRPPHLERVPMDRRCVIHDPLVDRFDHGSKRRQGRPEGRA